MLPSAKSGSSNNIRCQAEGIYVGDVIPLTLPTFSHCTPTSNMAWLFVALSTACYVSIYLLRRLLRPLPRYNGRPLPPGPTPLPVLGNLLDVPKTFPWRGYRQLSRQYGTSIIGSYTVTSTTETSLQARSSVCKLWDAVWSSSTTPIPQSSSSRSAQLSILRERIR